MFKIINLMLIVILTLTAASCQEKKAEIYPPLTKDEINGDRLWKRVTAEEDFEEYPEWPSLEGMQIGQSPHGRYHEIYIHPVLRNALPAAGKIAPEGSVIVKENYDAERNRVGYTVMAKVKGYDPAANDWFWASYDPKGKTLASGKLGMCIKCHAGLKGNDYVIVRPLDQPVGEKKP